MQERLLELQLLENDLLDAVSATLQEEKVWRKKVEEEKETFNHMRDIYNSLPLHHKHNIIDLRSNILELRKESVRVSNDLYELNRGIKKENTSSVREIDRVRDDLNDARDRLDTLRKELRLSQQQFETQDDM